MLPGRSSIRIKAYNWAGDDSQGLFDYAKSQVTESSLRVSSSGAIVRIGDKIGLQEDPSISTKLAEIKTIEGHSCLCPVPSSEKLDDKLWLVVKYMRKEGSVTGYRLSEGDVLKVGRMSFRVKELNTSSIKLEQPFDLDEFINPADDSEDSEDESPEQSAFLCRVCLGHKSKASNPLISPCNCGGTMKFIHLGCLQKYLKAKVITQSSESSLSFTWKPIECDLCKKLFPHKLSINNKAVELVQIPKPPGKYVVLETLCKDRTERKSLHLVSLYNKNRIRLGRKNDCELRFSDISLSRLHAIIKFCEGHFYVEDANSKFGTLVQIKRPIALDWYPSLSVQVGNTLMNFNYRKQWSLFTACFRDTPNLFEYRRGSTLFPIASGIPLSVSDVVKLGAFAGTQPIKKQNVRQKTNLLFDHNQVGANSSIEEDGEILELEEVEVATIVNNN